MNKSDQAGIFSFVALISTLFLNSCSSVPLAGIPGLGSVNELAEKALVGKFVKAFETDRPISTSINDAYQKAPQIQVNDGKAYPVSRKMMEDLRQNGHVFLNPGVYDFYLQSFCLHAGKFAPKSDGPGYAIAPLKGSQVQVIKHILQNYPRYSDVTQMQAQYLIWSIEVGCKYGDLPPEEQSVAVKVLSKDDLNSLGKSFWDILPKSVRSRLFGELKSQLPQDLQDVLETYSDIQSEIADSKYTYEQLESVAVRLGELPSGGQMQVVNRGTWYNPGKGYYIRVFPSGFTRTRVQVYVPKESGDPDYNPTDDIGAPADTYCQRLGFGCAGTGEGGYCDDNPASDVNGSASGDESCSSNNNPRPNHQTPENPDDYHCDINSYNSAIDHNVKNPGNWDGNQLTIDQIYNQFYSGQGTVHPKVGSQGYGFCDNNGDGVYEHMFYYEYNGAGQYDAWDSNGIDPQTHRQYNIGGNIDNQSVFVALN